MAAQAEIQKATPAAGNALKEIVGDSFINRKGDAVTFADRLEGHDVVLIYFSAHWCPPCRGFTPILTEMYGKWKAQGKKIECIFVSSDQSEQAMKEYLASQGDWIALKFGDAQVAKLKQKYGVKGIPMLIAIDGNTGATLDDTARGTVQSDKEEAFAKWKK